MKREELIYRAIYPYCKDKIEPSILKRFVSEVTALALSSVLHKHTKKLYDVLTYEFQSTKEVAKKVKMQSKDISVILTKFEQESSLIKVRQIGKLKSWRKKFDWENEDIII